MVQRPRLLSLLRSALGRSPGVVLIGQRQCGKTTAARWIVEPTSPNYFDLENPASLSRLTEPMTALGPLRGVVVIDEIQRLDRYPCFLPGLAYRRLDAARFLILGSASPAPSRQSSETLAGRVARRISLAGFGSGRAGRPRSRAPLAAWRVPACIPGAQRGGQRPLARPVRADLSGTRPSPARREHRRSQSLQILEHAGARSRQPLERCRFRALAGTQPTHGPPLPRPAHLGLHGATAPAVAREPGEVAGQGTQGVRPR